MRLLIITSIYPGEGTPDNFTPVVHYYVKEWVRMGYDVRVIHTSTYYPILYYKIPKCVRNLLQDIVGFALPESRLNQNVIYEYEGVKVYRIPMLKMMPMSNFTRKVLDEACRKAYDYIQNSNFQPDRIISHWRNPQLAMMSYLKKRCGVMTTLVLHGCPQKLDRQYSKEAELYDDVDVWGYRSLRTKREFEKLFGVPRFSFICFSGIPRSFTIKPIVRDGSFHDRYVQVGMLIRRKHPQESIEALCGEYGDEDYSFDIVGDGPLSKQLSRYIEKKNLANKVVLCGRHSRTEVIRILDRADVFILISAKEVYGLVYIEAMARGCIVVASKGEGMDGIIEDGVNGFFCEAGNAKMLAGVIHRIRTMSPEQRSSISQKAIETSLKLTDFAVAKDYIDTVNRFSDIMKTDPHDGSQHFHSIFS